MDRRAVTLIELLVVMIVGGILSTILFVPLIMEQSFLDSHVGRYGVAMDASVAMDNLTRVLRFAKPGTVSIPIDGRTVAATIEGNPIHLPDFTSDTSVTYAWDGVSILLYTKGTSDAAAIANDITYFNARRDPANPNVLILQVTARQGPRKVSLETAIRMLVS